MPRTRSRPRPNRAQTLTPVTTHCPAGAHTLCAAYDHTRTVTTLGAVVRLTLRVRRCPNPGCPRFHLPYRPEAEPHFALPHHEFGLDVLALVGRLRHAEHRSAPEIHRQLTRRGVACAPRTVTNLLDRYDALEALASADPRRLRQRLRGQGRVVLAIDGLQPDLGHEVLWVLRDCLSGEVLLAQSLLSATAPDLRRLIDAVRAALPDDGWPPLAASGLRRLDRLGAVAASLDRLAARAGALPAGLGRLRQLLRRGLEGTAARWPPVRAAYRWVEQVAVLLKNQAGRSAAAVRLRLSGILSRIRRAADRAPAVAVAAPLRHFVKVTRSCGPGLFACCGWADVPRTNNDLEQLFGSHRYHERRSSGRKRGSPGLVVRGSVRVVSGLATRLGPGGGLKLAAGYVGPWREKRAELDRRREARRQQRRCRRDPVMYLKKLEELALQLSLPS